MTPQSDTIPPVRRPRRDRHEEDEFTPHGGELISNACSCFFSWEAELIATLESPIQIKIGETVVSGLQTLYKFNYSLDGTCVEGNLRFDEPTKSADPQDPTTGLSKPASIPQGPWDKFLEMVPDIYSKFVGEAKMTAKQKTPSCVEVRFSAELSSKGKFKAKIPGTDIGIDMDFDEGAAPPAKAIWTICCCCGEEGAPGACWSARRDFFSWEAKKFGRTNLKWTLNADLGGCGKVKKVDNVKKAKFF